MRIRSITNFIHPRWPINRLLLQKAGIFAQHAKQAYEAAGYPVQTLRMATPSFTEFLFPDDYAKAAIDVTVFAHSEGFEYTSLGPALPGNHGSYQIIPHLLSLTDGLFLSGHLTTPQSEIDFKAVRACAEIIHQTAQIEKNGFGNLRFAALANVPPWAPFFPAAYHQGKSPAFALALEAADLAVEAFSKAESLVTARQNLIVEIERHARILEKVGEQLEKIYQVEFKGLDFTLAPFPEPEKSIGYALERLGLPAFGLAGSLAASTFLTDTLDKAVYKRIGFNGLMLPILEDSTLAQRAAQGLLSVGDLLLYSSVCGTGLDTIPLPGETSVDQLYAVLLDLAALSLRLNKPLTARLMPIPGKTAGDETNFDFEFFANSKVLALNSQPLNNLLNSEQSLNIQTRPKK